MWWGFTTTWNFDIVSQYLGLELFAFWTSPFSVLDSTKSNATFQKLHVFIPSFKKRGDAPIQLSPLERFTASRTWGCEYTLPDLHNSYTPEGPAQARTEYTYGQLYTQEKSKSKSKLHCILISHSTNPLPIAQPQQLQTHHIAKKGLLPPPPCLW
jgi:hypothetical protein